jgi:hypothetical protein
MLSLSGRLQEICIPLQPSGSECLPPYGGHCCKGIGRLPSRSDPCRGTEEEGNILSSGRSCGLPGKFRFSRVKYLTPLDRSPNYILSIREERRSQTVSRDLIPKYDAVSHVSGLYRGVGYVMRTRTSIPCLLPIHVLDFGTVQPGGKAEATAGICNWPVAAQITAALTNDTSGGLFSSLSLTIYNVEPGDPFRAHPTWELVPTATGDGSIPLPVVPGQTVGVSLSFNAPSQQPLHDQFSATVQIRTGPAVSATIPVSALVEAPAVFEDWSVANPLGKEWKSLSSTDPLAGVFHAGHVNDTLVLTAGVGEVAGGALLVGTDAGGVWLVEQPGRSLPTGEVAIPLTDWDVNSVTCLCQGPSNPEHIYVGTTGTVFETEDLFSASRDISPAGVGTVYKILVTNAGTPRRIVVASDGGVFWSNIPLPGGAYQWTQVSKLTNGQPFPAGAYSGLALGPNDRIVAAAWGANFSSGHYGIFYGDWLSPQQGNYSLAMTVSQLPHSFILPFGWGMDRTSLASSPQDPHVMYAVSAQTDASIYAVLASSDGGTTWTRVAIPPLQIAGRAEPQNQGFYNNCIAVSPFDSKVVAIGWMKHYMSRDGGKNWQVFDHLDLPALHDDVHAVYFDPSMPPNERLYVCSDGGVALTSDQGQTFDTSFSRFLANIECYGWNTFSVHENFMACGTQDNGNMYCALQPRSFPPASPWVQVSDGLGDGGIVAFIGTGQLITNNGSFVLRPDRRSRLM